MEKIITNSETETKQVAKDFTQKLGQKEVICFFGDLGVGKTTFIQGLAKALGVKQRIISPTFIIMRQYPITNNGHDLFFYHADLYRIENSKQAENLGLEEIFENDSGIICIEWSEKISEILPKNRWEISLKVLGESEREISINKVL